MDARSVSADSGPGEAIALRPTASDPGPDQLYKDPAKDVRIVPTHKRHGRRQPYTERGISRVPCFRCGGPGRFQWQVCADSRLFRVLCASCDVALNRMVLEWMGHPEAGPLMRRYESTILIVAEA